MSESRLLRWSPVSGIAFVALFVVTGIIFSNEPAADASDAKILAYYARHGNQVKLEAAYFVCTVGAVFFLWFLAILAGRVRQLEPEPGWHSRAVLVSGGAFTVFMLLGFALGSMVPATADHTNHFRVDPDTARLLNDVIYPLTFETALPLAAPLVLATSLVFLRTGFLPRWLGWAGVGLAPLCVAGFLGVPMALFLAWIVVVAVYLMRPAPISSAPA